MREVDFYEVVCANLKEVIDSCLPEGFECRYAHNQMSTKTLQDMYLYLNSTAEGVQSSQYVPKLEIDCLFRIFTGGSEPKSSYIIVEAKYGKSLGFIDFSQLIGYLQTSGIATTGLLVNISKVHNTPLSRDFEQVITAGALNMKWDILASGKITHYQAGILGFQPGGTFGFINTNLSQGIADAQTLVKNLLA